MSEEIKNNQPLNDSELDSANGGFAGSDKYSFEQYSSAGVAFEHNIWSKDKYAFNGTRINQDCAEEVTDFYFKNGRKCTQSEFELIKSKH